MKSSARALRMAKWLAATLSVAALGALIRLARRIALRQPRVLHGFSPLMGIDYCVRVSRLTGLPSHSAVWYQRRPSYELVRDKDFDRVIGGTDTVEHDMHWLALLHLLLHADIWVTYFDGLFFHRDQEAANDWALRLVKLAGIRIVVQPHGNDMVYRSRLRPRYDWVGRMQRDYPLWDLAEQADVAKRRIRLFCRHADFVIGGGWYIAPLLPRSDAVFHPVPIDCDSLRPGPAMPLRTSPVVIHSPNHRNVKGTAHLIEAMEYLHSVGIDGDLRIMEKVPRHLALERYQDADIVADQFCIGTIGLFALEAMALGKPVLAYVDHAHLADPVFNHPVVNTNPENLARVLCVLLQVPALRERLGKAGRASVERYQSIPAMAEVWGRIYRHVWSREPLDLETTEHFSSKRTARAFTEDPSQESFWPVPVDDLMSDIRAALTRHHREAAGSAVPA
jgi:glycosyltransferase involved in cell wall biosynthesis